jgi:hypothetical protein
MKYRASLPTRKYTDKNGQEKTAWKTIGSVFEGKNGKMYLKLDRTVNLAAFPSDSADELLISLFPDDDSQHRKSGAQLIADDDIPF